MKGKLILENGMSFDGKIFGHFGETTGEIVFTTGMTGYQEVLTDPSFYGKIVVMTYPMVGNYGLNLEDMESDKIHLKGFIIKEDAKLPNNFRCEIEGVRLHILYSLFVASFYFSICYFKNYT